MRVVGAVLLTFAWGFSGASPLAAQLIDDQSLESLSRSLRAILVQTLPATLWEGRDNWGNTRNYPTIEWTGSGLRSRAHIVRKPKNDGIWRRIFLTTQQLPGTLEFRISDLKASGQDTQTFKAYLAFQAGIEFEQWIWETGVRLHSGSVRARMRIMLHMDCENLIRLEATSSGIPDLVFRLRVAKANVSYDRLVTEHVAGIGGTAAKLMGEAMHDSMRRFRPGLERDLLQRANESIVRAADTKEVRLSLTSLWKMDKK